MAVIKTVTKKILHTKMLLEDPASRKMLSSGHKIQEHFSQVYRMLKGEQLGFSGAPDNHDDVSVNSADFCHC